MHESRGGAFFSQESPASRVSSPELPSRPSRTRARRTWRCRPCSAVNPVQQELELRCAAPGRFRAGQCEPPLRNRLVLAGIRNHGDAIVPESGVVRSPPDRDAHGADLALHRGAVSAASGTLTCALPRLLVAQGDLVGLGDVVGLDGSQSLTQAFASLPQQLEGVGRGAPRGGAVRISPVFLDEVGLQSCGDFVSRLQRVVDGPIPCCVVNHMASIALHRSREPAGRASSRYPPGFARYSPANSIPS